MESAIRLHLDYEGDKRHIQVFQVKLLPPIDPTGLVSYMVLIRKHINKVVILIFTLSFSEIIMQY